MDLRERLDGYEVTVVPTGHPELTLVWSVADADADTEGLERAGATPEATFGVLALLDDYRITRVPARAAS